MKSVAIRSMAGALVLACAAPASAQSLADVARQEEERRKAVRSSGKVYTNDSLRPEPASPGAVPAAPPAPAAQPTASPTPSADVPTAPKPETPAAVGEAPRTEADWRKRVAAERDALSRAQIFAEALQSRINVLSADFVNRDDPAQRDVVAAERQKALAELDRVKQEIQQHQKAIATIQDEARRAGVPAGWTR
ncbi:MAG: hypothetical protein HYX77_03150 [Acidobacteria bacterium]|nr:hypothetical protein [Acidobacteriota bacterium]